MSQRRHIAHGWNTIVGEIRVYRSSFVDLQSFRERVSDALSQPAFDLSFGADRIDDRAAVRRNDKVEDFDLSGFRIDVNLGGLGAVIIGAGLVTKARAIGQYRVGIETTRADNRCAVVTEQPRARDVRNSYGFAFGAFNENLTVARDEILRISFQHLTRLFKELLLDIGSRVLHCIAAYIGKPAGERA